MMESYYMTCRGELRAGKAAAKAEKAAQQPPRLGKVKFEAEPLQVCILKYYACR